ncbi:MAG: TIGR03667 family PPOX class F420-dependent oxidoreductase [Acidobacteria bacterium]|nr:TIGR03667 family PPOX class F420-dependent oxidoreductase [Acidobacteriota bacterium]
MLDPNTPTDAKALALLEDAYIVWMTSVRPNGQPQSSPVWFIIEDDEFVIYSLGDTARIQNLEANPLVSLNLDSNAGADVVTVEGVARVVDGPPSTENVAYQEKYRDGIRDIGHTPESFAERYSVALRITPKRWRIH